MSDSEGKLTTAIVIGAGQRGFGYAHYQEVKPEEFRVSGEDNLIEYKELRAFDIPSKETKLLSFMILRW